MQAPSPSLTRTLFRWTGMLGFITLVVLASLWFLGGAGLHGNDATGPATTPSAAQIERGSYLARVGNCAHCHTARGGAPYAGGRAIDTPFGQILSPNITPDRFAGLGQWTAQDFWGAMHHGMSKDGRALYPAFPYTSYTRISRADSDALFAYLQTQAASTTLRQPHALRWPYNTELALRVWRALYFTPAPAVAQAPSDGVERGAYLVQGLGHCMECHSARNALGAMASSGKGGYVLPGNPWFAPALNDAAQASVAAWSEDDTVQFLQQGVNHHAVASGPMAEVVLHGTQHLSVADARAMTTYLRALPQRTEPASLGSPNATPRGAALYAEHCAQCHGKEGQGQPGAYPALAGNRAVTMAHTNNLVLTVLGGGFAPATHGNPRPYGMPPFVLQLGDADVAEVLSYVRASWGNRAAAVGLFDVDQARRSTVK